MNQPPQPQPAPSPALRASDADRERIATLLRDSYTEGRLDDLEFQERLEQAYSARTLAELDTLTMDLPAKTVAARPGKAPPPPPALASIVAHRVFRYLVIILFLVAIWAATGRDGSFWPIWPIVVGGFITALSVLNVLTPGAQHRRAEQYQRRVARYQAKADRYQRRMGPPPPPIGDGQ